MTSTPSVLQSTTLDPLPSVLRHGLVAVAFFGVLSLSASLGLFMCMTYRMCVWYKRGQLKDGANQFLLLIYNLVLADTQQAMAFALTSVYLTNDKIEVGTTTCWANGWFVSTGDLASGVFILAIALHTFYAVARGRQVSNKVFVAGVASLWIFVYAMAIVGVGLHPGIYTRAGAWCWISHQHDAARLWLHYFWVFVCMFGTILLYALTFISLRAKPQLRSHTGTIPAPRGDPMILNRAARYMIIYPVVYVVCTLPLAGGRMASMTGMFVPYWWFCLAGAAITSCGWLDVLLYAVTRRVLTFKHNPPPPADIGLDTFGWKDSGEGFWGIRTTITGPLGDSSVRRADKRGLLDLTTRHSHRFRRADEDHFPGHSEGIILANTTIEVETGPITSHTVPSELGGIDVDEILDQSGSS